MSEPEGMRAVLVLGSPRVGKTWFINRFRDQRPDDDKPEALDNFPSKNVEIDGCPWRLMIIERSEEQDEEASTWIPLVEAIILMYSVDDEESFKQLENYVNLINESNTRNLRVTVVVGSKADLPPGCRRVKPEQLLKFSLCHKMPCFEVSSLKNDRINDVLLEITGKMKMQQHEILMRQRLRELTCKIVVVGACYVGKTVLLSQYAEGTGPESLATLGANNVCKSVIAAGYEIHLQQWDIAGHERYSFLIPIHLRGANAVVLMYSILDRESFEKLESYLNELEKAKTQDLVVTAVVGNKVDQETRRTVSTLEGRAFAERHNMLYFEVSALRNQGVNSMFLDIITRIICSKVAEKHPRDTIVLGARPPAREENKCSC